MKKPKTNVKFAKKKKIQRKCFPRANKAPGPLMKNPEKMA